MKIGHQKNFWGGVLFAVIGALFALIAKGLKLGDTTLLAGYAMGTPARMGPGFFPFWLGMILLALGLIIAFGGFKVVPNDPGKVEPFHWRPILLVLGAVCLFGIMLKATGVLIAGFVLVVVASIGSKEFKSPKPAIILGLCLTIFCAMVFVWGLKLPIPLCPDIEALQSSIKMCRG
jgi:Tripartite tricarboxylate transporter TctB family